MPESAPLLVGLPGGSCPWMTPPPSAWSVGTVARPERSPFAPAVRRSLGYAGPPVHQLVLGRHGRPRPTAEAQVESGHDEQAQQGRRDQAAQDHHGHRVHDLEAGTVAEEHERQQRQSGCERGRQDRREPFSGPLDDELGTEALALVLLEALIVVRSARSRCAPRSRTPQADRRARRARTWCRRSGSPAGRPRAAIGSVTNARPARRQLRKAACRSRKIPIAATIPKPSRRRVLASSPLAAPITSAWYSSGNWSALMRLLTSLRHVPDAAPAHVCADVDATLSWPHAGSRPESAGRARRRRSPRRT